VTSDLIGSFGRNQPPGQADIEMDFVAGDQADQGLVGDRGNKLKNLYASGYQKYPRW
jgi:hypothetical protein